MKAIEFLNPLTAFRRQRDDSGERDDSGRRDEAGCWIGSDVHEQLKSILFTKLPREIREHIWSYYFADVAVHCGCVPWYESGSRGNILRHEVDDEVDERIQLCTISCRKTHWAENRVSGECTIGRYCYFRNCVDRNLRQRRERERERQERERQERERQELAAKNCKWWNKGSQQKKAKANNAKTKAGPNSALVPAVKATSLSTRCDWLTPMLMCKRVYNETRLPMLESITCIFHDRECIISLHKIVTTTAMEHLTKIRVNIWDTAPHCQSNYVPPPPEHPAHLLTNQESRELAKYFENLRFMKEWSSMWQALASLSRLRWLVVWIPNEDKSWDGLVKDKTCAELLFAPVMAFERLRRRNFVLRLSLHADWPDLAMWRPLLPCLLSVHYIEDPPFRSKSDVLIHATWL